MPAPVSRDIRFYNHVLDSTGICLCFFIYAMIFDSWLGVIPEEGSPWLGFFSLLTLFCYFFVFEFFFGKTPAKFLTKTRVVDSSGLHPSAKKLIIRTFARAIPFNGFSFFFSTRGLHDTLSDTWVIANF
ncbi:MAG: RDD family protein [Bacteroidota bacterium]